MQIHELKRRTPNRGKKIVGRGGKRGKTSGKGTKGQKSRAGRKMRPEMRDVIKKLPKRRGYHFTSIAVKPMVLNLDRLQAAFPEGGSVDAATLMKQGIGTARDKNASTVKLLGNGEVTKKFVVSGCLVSKTAREKIEKAGGKIA